MGRTFWLPEPRRRLLTAARNSAAGSRAVRTTWPKKRGGGPAADGPRALADRPRELAFADATPACQARDEQSRAAHVASCEIAVCRLDQTELRFRDAASFAVHRRVPLGRATLRTRRCARPYRVVLSPSPTRTLACLVRESLACEHSRSGTSVRVRCGHPRRHASPAKIVKRDSAGPGRVRGAQAEAPMLASAGTGRAARRGRWATRNARPPQVARSFRRRLRSCSSRARRRMVSWCSRERSRWRSGAPSRH